MTRCDNCGHDASWHDPIWGCTYPFENEDKMPCGCQARLTGTR